MKMMGNFVLNDLTPTKIINSLDQSFQVAIFDIGDGVFVFCKRWKDETEGRFGDFGPICGYYDSEENAESEARSRNVLQ